MTRRRPLRDSERASTAELLRALADELDAGHAATVQRSIGAALDSGYPATASGAGSGGGGGSSSSRPEALAMDPDLAERDARRLLDRLGRLVDETDATLRGLQAWRPDRRVRSCPRCGGILQHGQAHCQRMIDGRRCGVCREPGCPRDGAPLQPGERMRDGRCDVCRMRVVRRDRATGGRRSARVARVERLHLQDNVIEAPGGHTPT